MSMLDLPGQPGSQMGMMNLGDIFGKAMGGRTSRKKMTVAASYDVLLGEEADKLLDDEIVTKAATTFDRAAHRPRKTTAVCAEPAADCGSIQ